MDIIIFPMRHKGRKGYDARVKQVRRDGKTISGLSVFIQYENPQITPAAEWLDYHISAVVTTITSLPILAHILT